LQPLGVVNVHAHVHGGNLIGDKERVQNPPAARLCDNYRVDFNTVESEGTIVLSPLSPGHRFVVTSSLMQILQHEGCFLPSVERSTWSHG